ncbi:hypothetical protein [Desulfosarcina sp.]|uniref:hypothetical protein n=1 Tax=Desulfosarcina sp. TaxID=2027861 RepID=UPI0039706F50
METKPVFQVILGFMTPAAAMPPRGHKEHLQPHFLMFDSLFHDPFRLGTHLD